MSLPIANTQFALDIDYQGSPWAGGPAKAGLGLFGLNTESYGSLYVTNDVAGNGNTVTTNTLITLDIDYWGTPWGGGPAKYPLSLNTLDYEYWGTPWTTNDQTPGAAAPAVVTRRRVVFCS